MLRERSFPDVQDITSDVLQRRQAPERFKLQKPVPKVVPKEKMSAEVLMHVTL